jgi:hypothetical protein
MYVLSDTVQSVVSYMYKLTVKCNYRSTLSLFGLSDQSLAHFKVGADVHQLLLLSHNTLYLRDSPFFPTGASKITYLSFLNLGNFSS